MPHWKFWFSRRQLERYEEDMVEWLRYKQLSYEERARAYSYLPPPPRRPHVNYVKASIGGELISIAYTECCDADKNPTHNSFADDAELVYEHFGDRPPIHFKDFSRELLEELVR